MNYHLEADEKEDLDDMDHVLNYLRQHYSYRIWALVGHSRGTSQFVRVDSRIQCSIPICCDEGSLDTINRQLFGPISFGITQDAD
jgi:hypothetical protein